MATTYEKIASTTLTGNQTDITFSSIPSTYTDLKFVVFGVPNPSAGSIVSQLRFNGDSATNYSLTEVYGNGSAEGSTRKTSANKLAPEGFVTTMPLLFSVDIFSYAGSTFKTCLMVNSTDRNGAGITDCAVGLYRSTSAINSITFLSAASNDLTTGTTATLYGILKA